MSGIVQFSLLMVKYMTSKSQFFSLINLSWNWRMQLSELIL